MKWINAEQQVTVTIYDEEHEEHLLKTMTVEEMLDTYSNEGCPTIYTNPERETGRWIPCSERFPKEEKKTYWVCTDTEYQCECRWTNNRFGLGEGEWGWSIFDTPQYTKVVAWMPLPEPFHGSGGKDLDREAGEV